MSMHAEPWDDALDEFWQTVDLTADPAAARERLQGILATGVGIDDARIAYERGSLHDSLGEEEAAIPLYRAALATGLRADLRTQATVQLASSLRNIGDASSAIALLRGIEASDPLADAVQAFLALALFSDGKPAAALRTALQTLTPHLPRYQRSVSASAAELVTADRVRAIVVGLLVRDGSVLLEEYPSNAHHGAFLRAPGGGIEFGETTRAALHREFAEELDATLDDAAPLAVTENIFDGPSGRGHEIVHVFAVSSPELSALPENARLDVRDSHTTVGWYPIADLRAGSTPVYPDGILDLLP